MLWCLVLLNVSCNVVGQSVDHIIHQDVAVVVVAVLVTLIFVHLMGFQCEAVKSVQVRAVVTLTRGVHQVMLWLLLL